MADEKVYLCPTCDHATHDYCHVRGVSEAQTECGHYKPTPDHIVDATEKAQPATPLLDALECGKLSGGPWPSFGTGGSAESMFNRGYSNPPPAPRTPSPQKEVSQRIDGNPVRYLFAGFPNVPFGEYYHAEDYADLTRRLAEAEAERDSEQRWASKYAQESHAAEARLKEVESGVGVVQFRRLEAQLRDSDARVRELEAERGYLRDELAEIVNIADLDQYDEGAHEIPLGDVLELAKAALDATEDK